MPKTKASPKAKSSQKVSTGAFNVSLVLDKEKYLASGNSIMAALEALQTPVFFKGKWIITITHDGKTSELAAYPIFFRRLFANKVARMIFEKRMLNALK